MYVDFKQGLVALNNVHSFLRLRNMFVYVAPDGHHVNSKSLFELLEKKLKIQTWPQDRDCTIDMNDTKIRFSVKYHPHDCFVPYLLFTYCAKWIVFSNLLTYICL